MDSDTGGKAKTAAGFSGCVQIQVAQPISQLTALTTKMKEISWVGHLHTRTANVRRYLIITNIKKTHSITAWNQPTTKFTSKGTSREWLFLTYC